MFARPGSVVITIEYDLSLALVFGFGLVHGLGFVGRLSEVEFPRDQFLLALRGFKLGVDVGQLFIIALAFLAVGWFLHKPWFHARIVNPCCLTIAGTGLAWTIQRVFFCDHRPA